MKRMMIVLLALCLVCSFATTMAQETDSLAQESAPRKYLANAYFGSLFIQNIAGVDRDNFLANTGIYSGIKLKYDFTNWFSLNSRLAFSGVEYCFSHLWVTARMKSIYNDDVFYFSIGDMPRPIAMLNRPEPISADGHFEPFTRAEIPGSDLGFCLEGRFKKVSFFWGAYFPGREYVEANLGFQIRSDSEIFRDFSIAYYGGSGNCDSEEYNHEYHGYAATLNLSKASLTFYKGYDMKRSDYFCYGDHYGHPDDDWLCYLYSEPRNVRESRTWSACGIFSILPEEKIDVYLDLVHAPELEQTNSKWKRIETGIWKTLSHKVGSVNLNHLLCFGVVYSEHDEFKVNNRKFYGNFYWQAWVQI